MKKQMFYSLHYTIMKTKCDKDIKDYERCQNIRCPNNKECSEIYIDELKTVLLLKKDLQPKQK